MVGRAARQSWRSAAPATFKNDLFEGKTFQQGGFANLQETVIHIFGELLYWASSKDAQVNHMAHQASARLYQMQVGIASRSGASLMAAVCSARSWLNFHSMRHVGRGICILGLWFKGAPVPLDPLF